MTDQKNSNHWDLLASELGADPPRDGPEDEPMPVAEQPEVPPETIPPEPIPDEPPPTEARRSERPTSDWDALASDLGVVPQPAMDETVPEEIPVHEPTGGVEEPGDVVQEPADSTERVTEATESKPSRRRRKRRRKSPQPDVADVDQPEAESADEVFATGSEEPADGEAPAAAAADDRSKRRRKRRTSSRKKKKEPESSEAAEEIDSAADGPERGSKQRGQAATKAIDSAKQPANGGSPAEDSTIAQSSHRAIPTWEEAIGLIVSSNLEARSRKPGNGSSRGWSGGRGSAKGQGSSKARGSGKKPPKKKS